MRAIVLALRWTALAPIAAFALGLEPSEAQTVATLSVPTTLQCTEGGSVGVKVTRTGLKSTTATFTYATSNGTAIAPGDYTAISGRQSVRKNASSYTLTLRCGTDDAKWTGNRSFMFEIKAVSGAVIGQGKTLVTVLENDIKPVEPPPPPPPPADGWIAYSLDTPHRGLNRAGYARATEACNPIRSDWGAPLIKDAVYRIVGVGQAGWSDGVYRIHWGVVPIGAGETNVANQTTVLTGCLVGVYKTGDPQMVWTAP